mgnify:CR=1 FL=1
MVPNKKKTTRKVKGGTYQAPEVYNTACCVSEAKVHTGADNKPSFVDYLVETEVCFIFFFPSFRFQCECSGADADSAPVFLPPFRRQIFVCSSTIQ